MRVHTASVNRCRAATGGAIMLLTLVININMTRPQCSTAAGGA
jgi:hypothetical protein